MENFQQPPESLGLTEAVVNHSALLAGEAVCSSCAPKDIVVA